MTSDENRGSGESANKDEMPKIRTRDKIWVALAVAAFVVAFTIILVYGVF